MDVTLILVDLDDLSADWQTTIRLAIEATSRRLYIYFDGTLSPDFKRVLYLAGHLLSTAGKQAHDAPDVGLLALLARYYNEVADIRPQLDLIPLFPFASWSLGQHDIALGRFQCGKVLPKMAI